MARGGEEAALEKDVEVVKWRRGEEAAQEKVLRKRRQEEVEKIKAALEKDVGKRRPGEVEKRLHWGKKWGRGGGERCKGGCTRGSSKVGTIQQVTLIGDDRAVSVHRAIQWWMKLPSLLLAAFFLQFLNGDPTPFMFCRQ